MSGFSLEVSAFRMMTLSLLTFVSLDCGAKTALESDPVSPPEPIQPCPQKRWSACHFLDEPVHVIRGELNEVYRPLLAWTGQAIVVTDGDHETPSLKGYSLDGSLLFERSLGGNLPQSLSWHPSGEVGVVVGREGVQWLDMSGGVLGESASEEMSAEQAFTEAGPTGEGFLLTLASGPSQLNVLPEPLRFAHIGLEPVVVTWEVLDDGNRRNYQPRHAVDREGFTSWVAAGDAPLGELFRVDSNLNVTSVDWYDGTLPPSDLSPRLLTGLAEHDGGVFLAYWMQRVAFSSLVWLLEVSSANSSRWWRIGEDSLEDEADLFDLGGDLIVATCATRESRLMLSVFDTSVESHLRDNVILGSLDLLSFHPRVTSTARGFAIVWHERTEYDPSSPMELTNLLQIADCCI